MNLRVLSYDLCLGTAWRFMDGWHSMMRSLALTRPKAGVKLVLIYLLKLLMRICLVDLPVNFDILQICIQEWPIKYQDISSIIPIVYVTGFCCTCFFVSTVWYIIWYHTFPTTKENFKCTMYMCTMYSDKKKWLQNSLPKIQTPPKTVVHCTFLLNAFQNYFNTGLGLGLFYLILTQMITFTIK